MKKRWLAIAVLTALLMVIGGTIGTVSIRQENVHSYSLYFVWMRTSGPQAAATPSGRYERTVNDGALPRRNWAGTLGWMSWMKGRRTPPWKAPFQGQRGEPGGAEGDGDPRGPLRGVQQSFRCGAVPGGLCLVNTSKPPMLTKRKAIWPVS